MSKERLQRQKSVRVQLDLTGDNEKTEEEQVQHAMAQSREEEEFRRWAVIPKSMEVVVEMTEEAMF